MDDRDAREVQAVQRGRGVAVIEALRLHRIDLAQQLHRRVLAPPLVRLLDGPDQLVGPGPGCEGHRGGRVGPDHVDDYHGPRLLGHIVQGAVRDAHGDPA